MIEKQKNKWDNYLEGKVSGWGPMDVIKKYAHGNILDIGCGFGTHLEKLRGLGELYGIDITEELLEKIKKSYPYIHFVRAPAEAIPFDDNFFDLIFSIEVVEHLKEPEIMFKEVRRVLKPGGYFIFQTPNYPVKRLYDFIFFIMGRRNFFRDDQTHVTKKSIFWWAKLSRKYFLVEDLYVRNILLEKKMGFGDSFRRNIAGKILGQKLIVVGKK